MARFVSSSKCILLAALFLAACGGGDDGGGGGGGDGADGGGGGGGGADGGGGGGGEETTYLRIDSMQLIDPHAYAFGSVDVTDTVNQTIAEGITMDTDDPPDGNLDVSIVLGFEPLDPAASSSGLTAIFPLCSAPVESTTCMPDPNTEPVETTATNKDEVCLDALPETTSDYDPSLQPATPRCFVSESASFDAPLGDLIVPLVDAQIGGTFSGESEVMNGVLRGFVSEETAQNTTIPEDVAVVGGEPLSSLLIEDDKDTGPNDEPGWWFYLNFTASPVEYTE